MTTTDSSNSTTRPVGNHRLTSTARTVKVTHRRVLVSEWIKFRSLRSIVSSLAAMAVALVAGAAFTAVGILVKDDPPAAEAIAADPAGGSLSGVGLGSVAAIVVGVVAVTTEYRTKQIRSSLAAVPTRVPLVWGKAAVAATVTAGVGLAGLLPAFLVGRAVVAVEDLSIFLTTPGVAKAMVAAALGLGVTAAWAVGCGWLIRNTAGAIFALLAVLYAVPSFAVLLPPTVAAHVVPFLPNNAVAALTQLHPVDGLLPAWAGFAVYAGYAVLTLAAGALLLKRRDA
jgi:hypothetical protein